MNEEMKHLEVFEEEIEIALGEKQEQQQQQVKTNY